MYVIALIFIYCYTILCQALHPKYHKYSIIHEGDQIQNTITPHEIFVHQIDSNAKSLLFLFHALDQKTMFFQYRSEDIE